MKKLLLLMLVVIVTMGMLSAGTITVTKPASGETVSKGSPYTILWTKSGAQDSLVKIRLYNPAGTTKILDITNSTANNGSFSWPVPNSVANGSYVVRVKTLDNATWDDGGVFTISSLSITVTKPASGETVKKGSSYTIQWTKSGSQDATVKIRLYNPAGTTKILDITNSTANDGSFSWPVPNSVANGSYIVRVKTLDNVVWDNSNSFTISTVLTPAYQFEVYEPAYNSYKCLNKKLVIKWRKKLQILKKVPVYPLFKKYELKRELLKLKTYVKIEIISAKCPKLNLIDLKEFYKLHYNAKNLVPLQKMIGVPFKFWFPQWKIVTLKTLDDGSFSWTIPNSYKKGCYKVRVTKLPLLQYMPPVPVKKLIRATSKVFHLVPCYIFKPAIMQELQVVKRVVEAKRKK